MQQVEDPRTTAEGAFSVDCLGSDMDFNSPRSNAEGVSASAAGSLVLDISGWVTHALTSSVFAILAQEAVRPGEQPRLDDSSLSDFSSLDS